MGPLTAVQPTQLPEDLNISIASAVGEIIAPERDAITYFLTPVLITFVVLGFIGKLIILYAVSTVRQFNRAENLMLTNLSATSVATLISAVTIYIEMTHTVQFYGPVVCKFLPGIHSFMVPAEGFTMMCISLERTERVRFPMRRPTKTSAIKKIALVWSLALLLDLPGGLLFFKHDPDIQRLVKCRNTKQMYDTWIPYVIYTTTNFSLAYLLPCFWLAHDWIRLVSQLKFLIACQMLPLHSEYKKRQKKLIGHAIIFTSIFIGVKVPAGTHYFLYQLPPELLSGTTVEWVKRWKQVFLIVSVHFMVASILSSSSA